MWRKGVQLFKNFGTTQKAKMSTLKKRLMVLSHTQAEGIKKTKKKEPEVSLLECVEQLQVISTDYRDLWREAVTALELKKESLSPEDLIKIFTLLHQWPTPKIDSTEVTALFLETPSLHSDSNVLDQLLGISAVSHGVFQIYLSSVLKSLQSSSDVSPQKLVDILGNLRLRCEWTSDEGQMKIVENATIQILKREDTTRSDKLMILDRFSKLGIYSPEVGTICLALFDDSTLESQQKNLIIDSVSMLGLAYSESINNYLKERGNNPLYVKGFLEKNALSKQGGELSFDTAVLRSFKNYSSFTFSQSAEEAASIGITSVVQKPQPTALAISENEPRRALKAIGFLIACEGSRKRLEFSETEEELVTYWTNLLDKRFNKLCSNLESWQDSEKSLNCQLEATHTVFHVITEQLPIAEYLLRLERIVETGPEVAVLNEIVSATLVLFHLNKGFEKLLTRQLMFYNKELAHRYDLLFTYLLACKDRNPQFLGYYNKCVKFLKKLSLDDSTLDLFHKGCWIGLYIKTRDMALLESPSVQTLPVLMKRFNALVPTVGSSEGTLVTQVPEADSEPAAKPDPNRAATQETRVSEREQTPSPNLNKEEKEVKRMFEWAASRSEGEGEKKAIEDWIRKSSDKELSRSIRDRLDEQVKLGSPRAPAKKADSEPKRIREKGTRKPEKSETPLFPFDKKPSRGEKKNSSKAVDHWNDLNKYFNN